ncbi:MAG: DUF4238 domain-containing protein [Oscillospiraceae bacterium]|nr:DUF4238 domain-containing protein [Oscillospiraceae bacterium]
MYTESAEKIRLVKSHIQMPKEVLKRFHDEKIRFYYYDVKGGFVGSNGRAASTNSEQGYYSQSIENALNEYVETPLGNALKHIEKIDLSQGYLCITGEIENTIKNFIYALMARDPALVEKMDSHSAFLQFLPDREKHDIAVVEGMAFLKQNEFLSDYKLTIMVNTTEIPFVLPLVGIYCYGVSGPEMINLPISPYKALCLVRNDCAEPLIDDEGKIQLIVVHNPEQLRKMNTFAFVRQNKCNWGRVICSQKEELDRLKEQLDAGEKR